MIITVYTEIWVEGKGWQVAYDGKGRLLENWRKYRELYAENIAYELGDDMHSVLYTVVAPNGRNVTMKAGDGKNFYSNDVQ